jgi:hypothetical protein
MPSLPILYHSKTDAAADTAFKLTNKATWFESIDIFVYSNDLYLGDIGDQDVLIGAGDVYYLLHPCNLNDYYFKNAVAGANTRVVVAGILLSDIRKKQLGIPVD